MDKNGGKKTSLGPKENVYLEKEGKEKEKRAKLLKKCTQSNRLEKEGRKNC